MGLFNGFKNLGKGLQDSGKSNFTENSEYRQLKEAEGIEYKGNLINKDFFQLNEEDNVLAKGGAFTEDRVFTLEHLIMDTNKRVVGALVKADKAVFCTEVNGNLGGIMRSGSVNIRLCTLYALLLNDKNTCIHEGKQVRFSLNIKDYCLSLERGSFGDIIKKFSEGRDIRYFTNFLEDANVITRAFIGKDVFPDSENSIYAFKTTPAIQSNPDGSFTMYFLEDIEGAVCDERYATGVKRTILVDSLHLVEYPESERLGPSKEASIRWVKDDKKYILARVVLSADSFPVDVKVWDMYNKKCVLNSIENIKYKDKCIVPLDKFISMLLNSSYRVLTHDGKYRIVFDRDEGVKAIGVSFMEYTPRNVVVGGTADNKIDKGRTFKQILISANRTSESVKCGRLINIHGSATQENLLDRLDQAVTEKHVTNARLELEHLKSQRRLEEEVKANRENKRADGIVDYFIVDNMNTILAAHVVGRGVAPLGRLFTMILHNKHFVSEKGTPIKLTGDKGCWSLTKVVCDDVDKVNIRYIDIPFNQKVHIVNEYEAFTGKKLSENLKEQLTKGL